VTPKCSLTTRDRLDHGVQRTVLVLLFEKVFKRVKLARNTNDKEVILPTANRLRSSERSSGDEKILPLLAALITYLFNVPN
jgi:hypothetical protein